MEVATAWFLIAGLVLISMALAGSVLKRLPLSGSMFYLATGYVIGEAGAGLLELDPTRSARLMEHLTEVAVIISLLTAGLKLRARLEYRAWRVPLRLATVSMLLTVGLVTAVGVLWLDLPLGAAVLLGAVLAPTDPVLASDVQVSHSGDRDTLRFGLTGEAGLNDGTAFPFVMLGLGLLGLHDIGAGGWRWWTVDLAWAVVIGLLVGAVCGTVIARLVLYLRRHHREAIGLDDFLSMGLIAVSYGAALAVHAYGFLSVFAAGLALRHVELQHGADEAPSDVLRQSREGAADEIATDPEKAPAYMAEAVLGFNEQLERIGEAAVVVLLGALLSSAHVGWIRWEALWFVPLMLLVIRPMAVLIGLAGCRLTRLQYGLIAWFGIRGIGSMYYLMFAIRHGVEETLAERLAALVLVTMAVSIVAHGMSASPLMKVYEQRMPKP